MDFLSDQLNLTIITWQQLLVRFALTMVLSMIIGIDRDAKDKPMDFRAYMIIAVSSCAVAILGQELYGDYMHLDNPPLADFTKIIDGVLTGIGFLGAGAIVKRGDIVVGTATGASIWASGALGLAVGFGFYGIALMIFFSVLITLYVGGKFMEKVQGVEDKGPNSKEKVNEDD